MVAHSASKVIDTKYFIHQKAATRVDQEIWLAYIKRSINLQIFKKPNYHNYKSSLHVGVLDVLWGQPTKLIQVVFSSEFHEY